MNLARLFFAIFSLLLFQRKHLAFSLFSVPFKIEKSKSPPLISTTNTPSTTQTTAHATSSTVTTTQTTSATTTRMATTTVKPSSINAANSTTKQFKPEINLPQRTSAAYQCECDLEIHLCDINCCCDVDCTQEMLKSFLCDGRDALSSKQLHQGLPSCRVNDGWLCIFKDNSVQENNDRYNDKFMVDRLYSWPNYFPDEDTMDKEREHLVYGDDIMLYNEETNDVKLLDLPASLINSHCHISEPVRHLSSVERSCTMTSDEFQTFYTAFLEEIGSYKLLRSRKRLLNNGEPVVDKSGHIGINSFVCSLDGDPKSCSKIENQTAIQNQGCWKFSINIHHNFTYLTDMNVSLICNDDSELATNPKMFNVHFLQPNESASNEKRSSEKFGYQPGFPVITGKLIPIKDAVEENEKKYLISYFHYNASFHNMHKEILLPTSISGLCSDASSESIKFYENSLSQCAITIANNSILSAGSNYTKFCENLQGNIFRYLINDEHFAGDYDLYVSELGRPVNISSNWIRMESRNFDQRQVIGTYDALTNSFRCINMMLSVKYEFISARVAVKGARRQSVIKKSAVEFGNRVNLRFNVDEDITLPLYVYVRFFDATKNNSQKLPHVAYILNFILLAIVSFI